MYHTPQHTGEEYIFHKITAPRHYWAYVEVVNEMHYKHHHPRMIRRRIPLEEMESIKQSFKQWCAYKWETNFKDLEHIAYDTEQDARDSLPFVHWQHFWRDCDAHRWRHFPPNLFNDFFEVI